MTHKNSAMIGIRKRKLQTENNLLLLSTTQNMMTSVKCKIKDFICVMSPGFSPISFYTFFSKSIFLCVQFCVKCWKSIHQCWVKLDTRCSSKILQFLHLLFCRRMCHYSTPGKLIINQPLQLMINCNNFQIIITLLYFFSSFSQSSTYGVH